jgi:hypothetical protein
MQVKNKAGIYLLFLLVLGTHVGGCAPKLVPTSTLGAIDSKKRFLIATQKSEFKDTVVNNVVAALERERIFIEIIDVSKLRTQEPADYNAIFIVNNYKYFRINRDVSDFLEHVEQPVKEKIVLLNTAGSPSRVDEGLGVDAISSASEMENAQHVSDMIVQKVNALLWN